MGMVKTKGYLPNFFIEFDPKGLTSPHKMKKEKRESPLIIIFKFF